MKPERSKKCESIMAMAGDLTHEDVNYLIAFFNLEAEKREKEEKKQAIAEIKAIAEKAGIAVSLDDSALKKRKTGAKPGFKAKVKYRNSETGDEWTGRGIKPKWIKDLITAGKKLDDYLTDDFKLDSNEK